MNSFVTKLVAWIRENNTYDYILHWVIPEKIHTPPTEGIYAVRRGRGEKIVSDNSKCSRTSEGGRGLTSNFLRESGIDVFWNDPLCETYSFVKKVVRNLFISCQQKLCSHCLFPNVDVAMKLGLELSLKSGLLQGCSKMSHTCLM